MSVLSAVSFSSFGSDASEQEGKKTKCCSINPVTHTGRQNGRLQMTLLPLIPVIILSIQTIYYFIYEVQAAMEVQRMIKKTDMVAKLDPLITAVYDEHRTMAVIFTIGMDRFSIEEIGLIQTLQTTDHLAAEIHNLPDDFGQADNDSFIMASADINTLMANIRDDVLKYDKLDNYYRITQTYIDWLPDDPIPVNHIASELYDHLFTFKLFAKAQQSMEFSYHIMENYLWEGNITTEEYVAFMVNKSFSEVYIDAGLLHYDLQNSSKKYFDGQAISPFDDSMFNISYGESEGDLIASELELFLKYSNWTRILANIRMEEIKYVQDISLVNLWNDVVSHLVLYVISFLIQIPVVVFVLHNSSNTNECVFAMVLMFRSRSSELVKEKRRSELILCEMLPKSIARQLKYGHSMHPEQFESVTLSFIEIANYHDVTEILQPMDIVTYLNSVFSFIDNKLEMYDVYKVETVGAIYMVVSGLPIRNGDYHAKEIANLALNLVNASNTFTVPEVQSKGVAFRIGAHTGSCCAGVVGLKCPRYCLFGDTVNTASRMTSNSTSGNIQITSSMTDILRSFGGYVISHRGQIEVKGKGKMDTYWLKSFVDPPKVTLKIPHT